MLYRTEEAVLQASALDKQGTSNEACYAFPVLTCIAHTRRKQHGYQIAIDFRRRRRSPGKPPPRPAQHLLAACAVNDSYGARRLAGCADEVHLLCRQPDD